MIKYMLKRLAMVAVAALLITAPVYVGAIADAQPTIDNSSVQQIIDNGLIAGSNFDVSQAFPSGSSTASTAAPTTSTVAHNGVYVALGDSVTAGLGLPFSTNPSGTDINCGLSPQSYPFTFGKAVNMPTVNAACSGANINDLSSAQNANGESVKPQLDTAFSYGVPSLISITAGANDAHWQDFINICATATCGGAIQTTAANAYLILVQNRLQAQLAAIQQRSGGNPPLTLVTGYYNPISANCSAVTNNAITPDEVSWIGSEVDALNATIKQSLNGYSFAKYVPVTFQGHGICDSSPWVQGLNDAAPIHPNLTGQNGYAYVLLIAYQQAKAAGL